MPIKQTGTFVAFDKDGQEYTILEFTETKQCGTLDGPNQELEIGKRWMTGKRHVNRIAKGQYEIVSLPNIPITSNDPDAP